MNIRSAAGREVPTDRCACGRHKETAKPKCCNACGTGAHGIGCVLRQEAFSDTRRGVVVSEVSPRLPVFALRPAPKRRRRNTQPKET